MAFEFYDILGISRTATADEIKRAYRKRAMELHPDRHDGNKEKEVEFKKVNEAYSTLSEPTKKAYYDRHGTIEPQGMGGMGGDFSGFSDLGDIFESFFSGGFSGHAGRSRRSRDSIPGEDMEMRVKITFEESYAGVQKKIKIHRRIVCTECSGSGAALGSHPETCSTCGGHGHVRERTRTIFGLMEQTVPCSTCGGAGKTVKEKCHQCHGHRFTEEHTEQEVSIPAGVSNGMSMKLSGAGHAGFGAPAGDIFLHFMVEEEKNGLVRKGNDVHWTVLLHPLEAVLGTRKTLKLPVLGERLLEIPAGTQHGQVFKFRNDGFREVRGDRRGDLLITVQIEIPKKLSKKQRDAYEALAHMENLDVLTSRWFFS